MTFVVKIDASKRDAGGKGTHYAGRSFSGLDKPSMLEAEGAFIETLNKMHALSLQMNAEKATAAKAGDDPAPVPPTPVEKHTLHLHYTITEHGHTWSSATLEYPNVTDDMAGTILGLLDESIGELSFGGDVKKT